MLKGQTWIEVTFKVTRENILETSAKEIGGSASNSLSLKYNFNEINDEEVKRIMARAEEFQKSDEEMVETSKAFIQLDDLIYKAKKSSNPIVARIVHEMETWKSNNSSLHSREVYAKINYFTTQLRPYHI